MSDHPSPETIEAYVMDSLPEEEAEALEVHAAVCDSCAARLRREAQLERRLHQLGALAAERPEAPRRIWPVVVAAVAMAAAAASVMWLRSPTDAVDRATSQLSSAIPPVGLCDRRPDLCEQPETHGIAVVGTAGIEVPRYEEGPALLSWRSPRTSNQTKEDKP